MLVTYNPDSCWGVNFLLLLREVQPVGTAIIAVAAMDHAAVVVVVLQEGVATAHPAVEVDPQAVAAADTRLVVERKHR
jgi:hypothetical protein